MSAPRSQGLNRRELLAPRHVASTAGQVVAALDEIDGALTTALDELAMLRLGWRAMATGWQILLPYGTPQALEAGQEAFELLDRLEAQLSVYRPHSEVSRMNRLAPRRAVRLEAELFHLLDLARRLTEETAGTFDATTGTLIKAWGFFQGPRRVPSEEERLVALRRVGMRQVLFDPETRSVRYLVEGLEFNLGSIGKGYALDRLAAILTERWKIPAVLLHGGSSSVYAKGDPLGSGRGWRVRVRHPWIPGRYLGEVWLRNQALGTSAATFQYLVHEGRKLGHVLDPRTGWPASGMASASVVAPSGALADALSTAFYVGGLELAQDYCRQHPEVGALLLLEGERVPVVLNLTPADVTLF